MGDTIIMNNSYISNTSQEGGAVTGFQSEIFFTGNVNLVYNTAVRGGAIAATQSKLYMYGNVTVSHNTASVSGGGIYAYQSELNFKATINIIANSADMLEVVVFTLSVQLQDLPKNPILTLLAIML